MLEVVVVVVVEERLVVVGFCGIVVALLIVLQICKFHLVWWGFQVFQRGEFFLFLY